MNADRLLAYYEQIADAPEAIARLRRLILDLAVHGKLVPQYKEDEPASELLKRIAKERARLVKEGEIRTPKFAPALCEPPFPIPFKWQWSQLAEVGVLSPRNEAPDSLEASFVPMPLIAAEYGVANQHKARPWGEIKKGYTHFAEGDIGLAKITPCFENGKSTVFRNLTGGIGAGTTELHIVRPILVSPDYIVIFLKCPHFIETGIPNMTGTAGQKRVPTEYFAHSPFPLPPLAEQHRIVAKVDELMALCDRLEAARSGREAARDRLSAASLARLNAPDHETFHADARFALGAMPALTTRPDQIKHVRQTILNLAVRGRLVPQDPEDEFASVLLTRIENEKARLVKNRQIPSRDILPPITLDRRPFTLPDSWVWTRLGTLCFLITDGAHHTPSYQDKGVPFLSVKDISGGVIDFANTRFISREAHHELAKRCNPAFGDILLTKVGTTGIAVEVDTEQEFSIFVSVALLKFSRENIDGRFLCYLINSPFVKQQSADNTQGIGNKNLVLRLIKQFAIPLPPIAEQRRIVAKVDALMALCDRLEASLIAAVTTRRRLLDALMKETMAPADACELAAAE